MFILFVILVCALGTVKVREASFKRLKAITPPENSAKMWLTKQTELVLMRFEHSEDLAMEEKIQAIEGFEEFAASLLEHGSELRVQRVAHILAEARTQIDLHPEFDGHEFFLVALALRLFDDLEIDLLGRFPNLIPCAERQQVLSRLVLRLQAHEVTKFWEYWNVGQCTDVGNLLSLILDRDTEELDVYVSNLLIVEQGMNSHTREHRLDVRFTYIPNALVSIFCTPVYISEHKAERVDFYRFLSTLTNDLAVKFWATQWARKFDALRAIPYRRDEVLDISWGDSQVGYTDMRKIPIALYTALIVKEPLALRAMQAADRLLGDYIRADRYLKETPGARRIRKLGDEDDFDWADDFTHMLDVIARRGVDNFAVNDIDELEEISLSFNRAGLYLFYYQPNDYFLPQPVYHIPPLPSVHASQIRIYRILSEMIGIAPGTGYLVRAISALIHSKPFAPAVHYNWLESQLRSLLVRGQLTSSEVAPEWHLGLACEITRRFGFKMIPVIGGEPSMVQAARQVCSNWMHISVDRLEIYAHDKSVWLQYFPTYIRQHVVAMKEFQKSPFVMGGVVAGFLVDSDDLNRHHWNPRMVSAFYAHQGALSTRSVLKASQSIPPEIRDILGQMSNPMYAFKPLVDLYETVYRNGMSNRVTRKLVQEGLIHTKNAFRLLVAARLLDKEKMPERTKPLVDNIWQVLKEYALITEELIGMHNAGHPGLDQLRTAGVEFEKITRKCTFDLCTKDSDYETKWLELNGYTPKNTENPIETVMSRAKNVRECTNQTRDVIALLGTARAALLATSTSETIRTL